MATLLTMPSRVTHRSVTEYTGVNWWFLGGIAFSLGCWVGIIKLALFVGRHITWR